MKNAYILQEAHSKILWQLWRQQRHLRLGQRLDPHYSLGAPTKSGATHFGAKVGVFLQTRCNAGGSGARATSKPLEQLQSHRVSASLTAVEFEV
jgi:hypothetical protein